MSQVNPDEPKLKKSKSKKVVLFVVVGGILACCLLCVLCFASVMIINETPQGKAMATKLAGQQTLSAMATSAQAQTETAAPTSTPTKTATLEASATPTKTATLESTATPIIESNVKAIMNGTGLNEKDAQTAFEVIKSVGFTQVEEFKLTSEADTTKAYRASLGYTDSFVVIFEGNKISEIYFGSITLYDQTAGGVLDKITNYTLTTTEKSTFIYLTQENVKQFLKAPSTAEFPDVMFNLSEWRISRQKDIVWVQSWVDADNAFGVKLRNKFTAQYSYSSQNLLYLEIAGKVVYGSPKKP